jgi:hypothetical protein
MVCDGHQGVITKLRPPMAVLALLRLDRTPVPSPIMTGSGNLELMRLQFTGFVLHHH